MRVTRLILVASVIGASAAALAGPGVRPGTPAETVRLTAGGEVTVRYDPLVWELKAPAQARQPETLLAAWALRQGENISITVTSDPTRRDRAEFKRLTLLNLLFMSGPVEFLRERRETHAGREWLVLELYRESRSGGQRYVHYFVPTNAGHVQLLLFGEEADLAAHRDAIEAFLDQIRVE